jgi:hypothetical protein
MPVERPKFEKQVPKASESKQRKKTELFPQSAKKSEGVNNEDIPNSVKGMMSSKFMDEEWLKEEINLRRAIRGLPPFKPRKLR